MKRLRFQWLGFVACVVALQLASCEPKLVVGEWSCPAWGEGEGGEGGAGGGGGDGNVPIALGPVSTPWSTSFEYGFCDYARIGGFCYRNPTRDADALFSIVSSPVHSGKHAAMFRVRGDVPRGGKQARCVVQGEFPQEAYYSAWYLIPAFATNTGNWNLLHFQGGKPGGLDNIWDISVSSNSSGELKLYLYDALSSPEPTLDAFPPIPIGEWFQMEVYFKRASDATGEFSVFQNGERVYQATELVTDKTTWGQFYVGNLASALMPVESTVYVDDVMIRETR